ncbi:Serine/threonine-protein kinase 33 [Trichoplax sp. H2]|nr:Serine/threonine-protein kinase 33 [Trichoplax sp. H2]|eukprot:RDD43738.1 Serine/threonine-protein kinase 33 [Trichoplax sp. H2]
MSAKLRSQPIPVVPHTRIEEESDLDKIYHRVKTLGKGGFGVVYKAVHRQSGRHWAIKIIHKEKAGSSAIRNLEREVNIMKMVQHEHIVKLHEVYETSKQMYLVMELCDGGEILIDLKNRGSYTENQTRTIMKRLASAVAYLDDHNIVHRDLKLANILLKKSGDERSLNIKVSDFGLACIVLDQSGYAMMQTTCGTPLYMAPEVINDLGYTRKCDVWSIGVIMYMLLCGEGPFIADDEDKLFELIKKGEITFNQPIWKTVSDSAKELLQRILCVNTAKRYTAKEILNHSWITGSEGSDGPTALELMRIMNEEKKTVEQDNSPSEYNESKENQEVGVTFSREGIAPNKINPDYQNGLSVESFSAMQRASSTPSNLNNVGKTPQSPPIAIRSPTINTQISNQSNRIGSNARKTGRSVSSGGKARNNGAIDKHGVESARSHSFAYVPNTKQAESHRRLNIPPNSITRSNSNPPQMRGYTRINSPSSTVPKLPPVSSVRKR